MAGRGMRYVGRVGGQEHTRAYGTLAAEGAGRGIASETEFDSIAVRHIRSVRYIRTVARRPILIPPIHRVIHGASVQ